ncbi:hypothetical protein CFRS1_v011539 [Colletotrichum fructicola]|nr:hypothetical protein CFRS1_v011539 [Colletotrichum fructicola]
MTAPIKHAILFYSTILLFSLCIAKKDGWNYPRVVEPGRAGTLDLNLLANPEDASIDFVAVHGMDELVSELAIARQLTRTERRPIIFIGHSLGGLVVKSALVHSEMGRSGHLEEQKFIKLSTFANFKTLAPEFI